MSINLLPKNLPRVNVKMELDCKQTISEPLSTKEALTKNASLIDLPLQNELIPTQARSQGFPFLIVLGSMLVILLVFIGYLYYKIANDEEQLSQCQANIGPYQESYVKAKTIIAEIEKLQRKKDTKTQLEQLFYRPNLVNDFLREIKPEQVSFENIEINGDGSFTIACSCYYYENFVSFLNKFENNKPTFTKIKADDVLVTTTKTGYELVAFKISGMVVRGSETDVK